MTDYESLISSYSTGFADLIYMSLLGTGLTVIIIFGWYFYKGRKQKKIKKEDDLKLQGYFEKYSDIIADKVVEKLKNQNPLQ